MFFQLCDRLLVICFICFIWFTAVFLSATVVNPSEWTIVTMWSGYLALASAAGLIVAFASLYAVDRYLR